MKRQTLCALIAGLGAALGGAAHAQISGGMVKIGVLNDIAGP